jgi:hypothetical protein
MSVEEEAAPDRGKKGDDVGWVDVNLIGPKNKENSHGRFNGYKWMINI